MFTSYFLPFTINVSFYSHSLSLSLCYCDIFLVLSRLLNISYFFSRIFFFLFFNFSATLTFHWGKKIVFRKICFETVLLSCPLVFTSLMVSNNAYKHFQNFNEELCYETKILEDRYSLLIRPLDSQQLFCIIFYNLKIL